MSVSITWMCGICGKRVEGLNVTELVAFNRYGHECRVSDLIRRAAHAIRSIKHPLDAALEPVAEWLNAMANQAEAMTGPGDFGVTDEPGSVQYALAVARALPDEEDWS